MTKLTRRIPFFSLVALLSIAPACSQQSSVGASESSGTTLVATLDGEPITDADLDIKGELMKLEQEAYKVRQEALDRVIGMKLLQKKAEQAGQSVEELLAAEVDSKISDPTPEEVKALYERSKSRIRKPFEEVKDDLARAMRKSAVDQARREYIAQLRQGADVNVLIEPPRLPVNTENAHRRGPADAPVTLVEFSDFQCPFCKRVQPTLQEIFSEYEGQVSWVFKDLPLTRIHPGAQHAAEAARCAGEQDKFWEYRDALFEAARVNDEVHPDIAKDLNLDLEAFEKCLASDKYQQQIRSDSQEAQSLGISGTPAFLINGILLSGAQPKEEFVRVIEAELSRAN